MNSPICWSYLVGRLVFLFLHQWIPPAMLEPTWKSRQFPCTVTSFQHNVTFDCQARKLNTIPDGITSDATSINFSRNNIHNITNNTFCRLEVLVVLNLYRANDLGLEDKDINGVFKNLTKLQELYLGCNRLTTVPSNLPLSLTKIDLRWNRIVVLHENSFSGITNVRHLLLFKNCFFSNNCSKPMTIADKSLAVLTKLEHLDLSANNLTCVPKGLPPTLKELALSNNQIQYIFEDDFKGLSLLESLVLLGNCPRCENAPHPCVPCPNSSLGIHPNAFTNLKRLKTLNLSGNSLTELRDSWFENLRNLTQLFLSFNVLQYAIQGELNWFSRVPNLELLDMSFNYAPKSYPETIKLSNNFSSLESLRVFHLVGLVFKRIESDTFKPLVSLKKLGLLNLGTNFIVKSYSTFSKQFRHLNLILSENRLYPTEGSKPVWKGNSQVNMISPSSHLTAKPATRGNLYKPECKRQGRILSLSSNNLFYITPQQFEGYYNIACLNLSKNGFSSALNGTEFSLLPNLTYLDLSYNKIDPAYGNAFKELPKLKVLDISYNDHYFKAIGVTIDLSFLKNLPVLEVLNMSNNCIYTLTTKRLQSDSLNELRFGHNELGKLWKDGSYVNLFTELTNLTILDISFNHIDKILYDSLPRKLRTLIINHNRLDYFDWTQLQNFCELQVLDLSYNYLTVVQSLNSSTLTTLNLSRNNIAQLDKSFLRDARSLTTLFLDHNNLTVVHSNTFSADPENYLETLSLDSNPFQCVCEAQPFINWINNNTVTIPRLTTEVYCYIPTYPSNRNVMITFDFNKCGNGIALVIYILTSTFIIMATAITTVAHIFYWDVPYVLHYLKAKLRGYCSATLPDDVYDVFVTYDTRDPQVSEWVLETLRVKLEDECEEGLPLCLEERDWPLGTPLLDNLTRSILQSRKTLFVLTKAYAETGTFRLAMYLAHQRLLDENRDVIVVLMLEPVLQRSHFLRLRQRLCGDSVVEWPRTAAAESWFWQNLRNVLTVDSQWKYTITYSKYFRGDRD